MYTPCTGQAKVETMFRALRCLPPTAWRSPLGRTLINARGYGGKKYACANVLSLILRPLYTGHPVVPGPKPVAIDETLRPLFFELELTEGQE